jgi:hypothetical protein
MLGMPYFLLTAFGLMAYRSVRAARKHGPAEAVTAAARP